jgi:cation transport protein ChaC
LFPLKASDLPPEDRFPLDRENILSGRTEARLDRFVEAGVITKLTPEQRRAAMEAMLAEITPGEDIWIFAYGSLMWNPTIHFEERLFCRVHGYHRQFCFWSVIGRGSPDAPGLMLSLESGGSCAGAVYRVKDDKAHTEAEIVFLREMLTGMYRPKWVTARTERGPVKAITFVSNRDHQHYAGRIDPETAAQYISQAEGHLGPCQEYLENCIRNLAEFGIRDRTLDSIYEHIEPAR